MKRLNRSTIEGPVLTERVLQFGGGNFLRGFADWMIDVLNQKSNTDLGILLVSPMSVDGYKKWQDQEGLYHVLTRGIKRGTVIDESHLVTSVSRILHCKPDWDIFLASAENPDMRFIISNTTEAGIKYSDEDRKEDTPPTEFPAKLTLWLYKRYNHFQGDGSKGCIIVPTELITDNGEQLKKCILQNIDNWGLEDEFKAWINDHNHFCNTLVDRIVPGISKDALPQEMEKIGYEDHMMTEGEVFHFWAIEAPEIVREELPLHTIDLDVIYTDDLSPYRTRKVRILNGAHTTMVPVGYLYGIETVRETIEHEVLGQYMEKCLNTEIIPTLDLPSEELNEFAADVLDRFRNPFIKHYLLSISLNSISKFKTRVLPSILTYIERKGTLPQGLVFSFACLIQFYKGNYQGKEIKLNDNPDTIAFFADTWSTHSSMEDVAGAVLQNKEFWGEDLSLIPGLQTQLSKNLQHISDHGVPSALKTLLS